MQRYNVFLQIHKGLRAMMYETSIALQHTDFDTASNYPPALVKLTQTLEVFDAHAGHEDNFIFSLLHEHCADFVAEMEAEHVTDHALSHQLRALIADYKEATEPLAKHQLGAQICHAFNAFIAFNLTHLNKEETAVNEQLWKHYTDMDIITANRALVSSLKPEEAQMSALWMIKSGTNNELAKWLKGMKGNIPEPMMEMLMGLAKRELPAERFEVIEQGMVEAG